MLHSMDHRVYGYSKWVLYVFYMNYIRYNDVLCMDSTRVRLKARRDYDDYIHASWITMPDKQKYICTQVTDLL